MRNALHDVGMFPLSIGMISVQMIIQAGNFISIYGLFNLVGGTYLKNYCNRAYQDLGSV